MKIQHNAKNDCLGKKYDLVIQNNYPASKKICINYVNTNDSNTSYISHYTVAIFKLKLKN